MKDFRNNWVREQRTLCHNTDRVDQHETKQTVRSAWFSVKRDNWRRKRCVFLTRACGALRVKKSAVLRAPSSFDILPWSLIIWIYQYYYSSIIIIIIIICTSHFFFFFNCEELIEHQPSNFEGSVLVISKDREELFPQVQLSNKIFIIKLAFKTSRKQTNPRGCLNNCGITHLNFQRNHSQQGWKSETPATTYDEIYTGYGEITPWYWSTFVKISLLDTLS